MKQEEEEKYSEKESGKRREEVIGERCGRRALADVFLIRFLFPKV
jgi:hypothetical protein